MPTRNSVIMTGLGFELPDKKGVCDRVDEFWDIIKNGKSNLSVTDLYPEINVKVVGEIKTLDTASFNMPPKYERKYSRAAFIASLAVRNAMKDAGLSSEELSNDRTLLISASSIYALENVSKQYERYIKHGSKGVGFDYFLQGTPPSVPCAVSKLLNLDCPMMTLGGSCVTGPHALQIAYEKLNSGLIDRAIIVGVEANITPLYLASVSYRMKNNQTINTMSQDPKSVKPHDKNLEGNACGEGGVAIILERGDIKKKAAFNTSRFKMYYSNSRKNGASLFDSGEPGNIARTVKTVLKEANICMDNVGFINDFAEGTGFIEDFFCDAINDIRKELNYSDEILLTNQEAAFGHIAGISGLVKCISNIMMMNEGIVTPVINCKEKCERLNADPVIGEYKKKQSQYSMFINVGAGGDCTVTLLEKVLN